jgi:hypothetical protein
MSLPEADAAEVRRAKQLLESPGLAIRIADYVGMPIEALVRRLPDRAQRGIGDGIRTALEAALDVALGTLAATRPGRASDWLHRGVALASGAIGGAAGLAGLAIELPLSTTVMLRSIADHARAQGEDLSSVASRLECLTVFALGSRSRADDAADSAYFAARAALAHAVSHASEYVAECGAAVAIGDKSAPVIAQLIARIARRFGVAVGDKVACQMVPVVGAVGGAAVNTMFLSHYQDVAWAHFSVRRLERVHGPEAVRAAYDAEAVRD